MEKLIEYCQTRYNEELNYKLSLINIICWLLFVITIHAYYEKDTKLFLEIIKQTTIISIVDLESGIFSEFTIFQLIISLLCVLLTTWTSKNLSTGLFYIFCLKSDFTDLIIKISLEFINSKKTALAIHALPKLKENKKKIERMKSLSEISLAVTICGVIGFEFHPLNIATSLASFFIFIAITWMTFHKFIEEVLPYSVAANYSKGQLTEIMDSFTQNDDQL